MKGLTLFILLVIIALVLVEVSDCRGTRSRTTKTRSSRRSKQSRSRSKSSSNRSNTRRSSSSVNTPRVYKYTPIPVYNSRSPVIIKQTKPGSRSNLARNAFFGYMLYRSYSLMRAPVYRRRYYIHRSTVEIPDERAIRLKFTKEIMLNSNGTVCFNSSKNYTLVSDKNERVSHVFTSVRYSDLFGGKPQNYSGDNQTVSVDMNALDQSVEISTIVKYNGTIVANTSCVQIQSVINGTIVQLYATNPDADAGTALQSSFLAVIFSTSIYLILQLY